MDRGPRDSDASAADRLKLPGVQIAHENESRHSHSWHCSSSTTGIFEEADVSVPAPIPPAPAGPRTAEACAAPRELPRRFHGDETRFATLVKPGTNRIEI